MASRRRERDDPHRAPQAPGAAQGTISTRVSPRLQALRNSAIALPHSSRWHPLSISANYPGLLQIPQLSLFQSQEALNALATLKRVVNASLAPASDTDIAWTPVKGDPSAPDRLDYREVTLPNPDLSSGQLKVCKNRAKQSFSGAPRALRMDQHYRELQNAGAALGAAALLLLRELPGMHDGLFFMATQISSGPRDAKRTRHVDPQEIAAALATFSIEGTAQIQMSHYAQGAAVCQRPPYDFECNTDKVYMLTGELDLWFARHEVLVTSPNRIGVTLRFGAPGHPSSRRD